MKLCFLRFRTQCLQQQKNLLRPGLSDDGGFPACVLRQGEAHSGVKPCPRREHGAGGIKKGTEVPLPQEGGKLELGWSQHRGIIQSAANRLELRFISRFHRKHNAIAQLVSSPEGNLHPHSRQERHLLWNAVGVGLVNGKNRRRYRNFSGHKPSTFSFCEGRKANCFPAKPSGSPDKIRRS